MLRIVILSIITAALFASCNALPSKREKITLNGSWQFAMDTIGVGETEKWYVMNLEDSITLPGTTDLNRKSRVHKYQCNCLINNMKLPEHTECNPYNDTTTYHYTREYPFVGLAWYRKEIKIPASFQGKNIQLTLERTKVTKVWIDSHLVGGSSLLSAMQVFDVTPFLTPGKHHITILVDNNPLLVKTGLSHIYSYDTQTNWNGVLGEISLTALANCHIVQADVFPDINKKEVRVKLKVANSDGVHRRVQFTMSAQTLNTTNNQHLKAKTYSEVVSSDSVFSFIYPMGENPALWSEFNPAMYRLNISLETDDKLNDQVETSFGMREFKAKGTQFAVNGNTIFLRGKNDGCVFPLTGHPPVDTLSWNRYFRICKSYGINHVRFHSWCPPKSAFVSADMLGVYLQIELPYWGAYNEKDTTLIDFMTNEGTKILEQNGNSPSFCMLSLGNELNGSRNVMDQIVSGFKQTDTRHLYTFGTNSVFGNPQPGINDDFWVTMWTNGPNHANPINFVRSSFSTSEDENGGLINSIEPSTERNYTKAIHNYSLPIIGHEIGQFQIYPNFDELKKYTGVLKPLNYEVFKRRLEKAGMGNQANDFFRSSGQSCLIQYREEIETAIRTQGFGGFQVLDLQDYPGQATALVGILDPFMDSKGIITPQKFREFCSEVVPLLIMPNYCYFNSDIFSAKIQVANYSFSIIKNKNLVWKIQNEDNSKIYATGIAENNLFKSGKLNEAGNIEFTIPDLDKAEKLKISLEIEGTNYRNEYPFWVYPQNQILKGSDNVIEAVEITPSVLAALNQGKNILLFPDHVKTEDKTVDSQFINEFWNWLMFKGICKSSQRPISAGTLGLLINPKHPLFADFPTEIHSNWQWWNVMKSSRPYILDKFPENIQPIVQVIDNVDRNHKLADVFEFKCGKGKILVCMTPLKEKLDKPEVRHFYQCVLNYMNSEKFNPEKKLAPEKLAQLF